MHGSATLLWDWERCDPIAPVSSRVVSIAGRPAAGQAATMRVASLFSGAGGLDIGLHQVRAVQGDVGTCSAQGADGTGPMGFAPLLDLAPGRLPALEPAPGVRRRPSRRPPEAGACAVQRRGGAGLLPFCRRQPLLRPALPPPSLAMHPGRARAPTALRIRCRRPAGERGAPAAPWIGRPGALLPAPPTRCRPPLRSLAYRSCARPSLGFAFTRM